MFRKPVLRLLGCGLLVSAMLGAASSCSVDDRNPTVSEVGTQLPGAAAPLAPKLAVTPGSLDFGPAVVGSGSRNHLTVQNTGNAPLDPPSAALASGSGPDFLVLHNQCENRLAPNESCLVRLQLSPLQPGPSTATLNVGSSGQQSQVGLTGSGLAAGPLILLPSAGSAGDYGGVPIGSSTQAAFDVLNPTPTPSGPLSFTLTASQFQLAAAVDGDCQPGVTSLSNGQSCRVHVGFSPSVRDDIDGTLIATSALGSSALPLTGSGRLPAVLAAPDVLDFGDVTLGGAVQRTLRLANQGDAAATLADVRLLVPPVPSGVTDTTASVFSLQNSDCGAGTVLAGGESCGVTIAFRPLTADVGQQTQLLLSAADGTSQSVALSGNGIVPGALTILPAPGASNDFGAVAVGESNTQSFVVSNPSAQPSGPLLLKTIDDFAIAAGSADGACQSGVTSLVNGSSCSVSVTLTASTRGQHDGALMASTALAGAAQLALTGHGIIAGRLDLGRSEVDFGRLPTQTPARHVLTVRNTGDQPLPALLASVEAPGGGTARGFTLDTPCSAELAPGATCDVGITFLPATAASYAALLRLSAAGSATSALLLGRAFQSGALQIAASDGSGDFGDVALGLPRTLHFTLTNSGSVTSGRLTLASNNPLFALDAGDCSATSDAGLASGASCTFSITFTPTTSDQAAANVAILSLAAGETALSLSGRGRTASKLTATTTRDFGQANVNQDALREAANQFTWTVTNDGDLPSGALQEANDTSTEFLVSNDTCAGATVAGHGTCSIDLRFRPSSFGARAGKLTLTDPTSMQVLQLAMTGAGRIIAQAGQSCINAECAVGVCTAGVCCDRDCNGTCQVCSTLGVCVDQAEQQQCGDGTGRCFGVNQCLLPAGQACSAGSDCGSGNCEVRLSGQGPNDRICCLDDCGNSGEQCNASTGHCQDPTLAAGTACGAVGQLPCGGGLVCKDCRGGGRECTASDGCCGGCDSGYDCNGGQCSCPLGTNGQPQRDCGNGKCIPQRANACCSNADCPGSLPICDTQAGVCRQCLQAGDCSVGATGTFRSCNNFSCTYACSTQQGFKDCNGSCIGTAECCGGCTGGTFCQNAACVECTGSTQRCSSTGVPQTCVNGFFRNAAACTGGRVCTGAGQCNCQSGLTACGNSCVDTRSDGNNCGGCNQTCRSLAGSTSINDCNSGVCDCGTTRRYVARLNACASFDFNLCQQDSDCADSGCIPWFIDNDNDGFGNQLIFNECGKVGSINPAANIVSLSGDIDDDDATVH